MHNRIMILGIQLNNEDTQDAVAEADKYLQTDYLNIIQVLSSEQIMLAAQDENLKKKIESADLNIPGEKALIEAAAESGELEIYNIDAYQFVTEIMELSIIYDRTVFIITDTVEKAEKFDRIMDERFERLRVSGIYVLDDNNQENLINEINSAGPDVIMTVLPSPLQEEFIFNNRAKFNARVCLSIGSNSEFESKKSGLHILKEIITKSALKRQVNKYQNEKEK